MSGPKEKVLAELDRQAKNLSNEAYIELLDEIITDCEYRRDDAEDEEEDD